MEPEIFYRKKTIGHFLEELANITPTLPAGGCALALLGALAAATERFVAAVTLQNIAHPAMEKRLKDFIFRLEALQDECLNLMDRDVVVYKKMIRTGRRLKNNKTAATDREKSFQEAKIQAATPPMRLMESGLEMLKIASALIQDGHRIAVADAGVALEAANSCIRGGLWLTEANLAGITDRDYVKQKREIIKSLEAEAQALYLRAQEKLNQRNAGVVLDDQGA